MAATVGGSRVEPEGTQMRMWEAIETYMNRGQNLCIIQLLQSRFLRGFAQQRLQCFFTTFVLYRSGVNI